jgi:hypothetical protein
VLFFEKKNQKTFSSSPSSPDEICVARRGTERAKVFWFFFSKKNTSVYFVPISARISIAAPLSAATLAV